MSSDLGTLEEVSRSGGQRRFTISCYADEVKVK